jgi:hypothetical protein
MRDPARIETVLSTLRRIWKEHPDLRLGQLFVNAARPEQPCPELFYLEDDALVEGLLRFEGLTKGKQ